MPEALPYKTDWLEKRLRYRLLIYYITQKRYYDKQLSRVAKRTGTNAEKAHERLKEPSDMSLITEIVSHNDAAPYLYTDEEFQRDEANKPAIFQEELSHLDERKPKHYATDRGAYLTANAFQKYVHGDNIEADEDRNQINVQRRHYTSPPLRKLQGMNAFLMAKGYVDREMLTSLPDEETPHEVLKFFKYLGIDPVGIPEGEYLYGDYFSEKMEGNFIVKTAFEIQTNKDKNTYRIRITEYWYRQIAGESALVKRQRMERGDFYRRDLFTGWCIFERFKPILFLLEKEGIAQNPKRLFNLTGYCFDDIWIDNPILWHNKKKVQNAKEGPAKKPKKKEKEPHKLINNIVNFAYTEIYDISHMKVFAPQVIDSFEQLNAVYGENPFVIIASKNYASNLHKFIGTAIMSDDDNPKGDKKVDVPLAGKFLLSNTKKDAEELRRHTLTIQERMSQTEIANQIFERTKSIDYGKYHNSVRDAYIATVHDMTMEQMFLIISRYGHHEDITEFAEKTDVDINAKSNDGYSYSSLHMALESMARFNIKAILELDGLNPLALDAEGNLPSMLADQKNAPDDIIEMMMEAEKAQATADGVNYEAYRSKVGASFDAPLP